MNKGDIKLEHVEILSIEEEDYDDYVYDLGVERTHCFFADGFNVHNCHRLEGELYRFAEINFTPKAFAAAKKILSPEEADLLDRGFPNVGSVIEFCKELIPRIDDMLKRGPVNDKEEEEFVKLESQSVKMQDFLEGIHAEVEFVIKKEVRGSTVSPLLVDHVGHMAFKAGNKALLMSATILDADTMARSLGVTNYKYIEVPSTFPPENRPIISIPVGSMSYLKQDETFPDLVKYVKAILKKHKGEKGVIQTYNYAIAEKLQHALAGDPRLLFHVRDVDKQLLFDEHCNSPEPTVLIGPGYKEGVNLVEDLCRFMIIVKLPYPDLKNPIVKKRSQIDRAWYDLQVIMDLVQMAGRGQRSETDTCVVYILDSAMDFLYNSNIRKFPEDFRKAVVFG